MKIISWNVNGLRSIQRKGFTDLQSFFDADFVCLQEVKAQKENLDSGLFGTQTQCYFNTAEKRGYSGVAIYTKKKPLAIEKKLGIPRFDEEGRILKLQYPDFTLINLYIPHGGREKENLGYKLEAYSRLFDYLETTKDKNIVLLGDFNIAHEEIDLARPKDNRNNIMFTDKERKQIDRLIEIGFIDTFRKFHAEGGNYTWWPYRSDLRERNVGWRIDYIFVSSSLAPKLKNAFILRDVMGSDHCPIGIELSDI